jgi:hypothetical protein
MDKGGEMKWEDIKIGGNPVYKTGGVETIDLLKSLHTLHDWAVSEGIAKFTRNRRELGTLGTAKCIEDMDEIIHYAEMIKCLSEESASARQLQGGSAGATANFWKRPTN